MTITRRLLAATLISSLGLLVMPGTAWADIQDVPQAQYEAAYAAGIDASGIFAPTATVTFVSKGSDDGNLTVTVNPDGSLIGQLIKEGTTAKVRCVRINRCWEQSAEDFNDLKWHLLPAGSVTFQLARDYWSAWMGFPWPADATFFLGTASDGSAEYAVAYSVGSVAFVNLAWFEGGALSNTVAIYVEDDLTPIRGGTISASPYVKVTPPPLKQTGKAATQKSAWLLPINH